MSQSGIPEIRNIWNMSCSHITLVELCIVVVRRRKCSGHTVICKEHSKIPLLIGANLEDGGCGIATDGTQYGKQMQVAATGDTEDAYRLGKVSCSEGAAVGCNWAFAPVVDIDRNWRNPITNVRTYGDDRIVFLHVVSIT